jgi:hypothetical protein
LRAGAVRLVLDHSQRATDEVTTLLWQTAVRVEDGVSGMAEENLRQAQKALADALDRNAGQKEIQELIDRLHQALAQYLSELATHMAASPSPPESTGMPPEGMPGMQTNMLTPDDLSRMLEHLRDLSAAGAKDAAKQELSNLQQMLENIRTEKPSPLTPQQRQMLQALAALHNAQKEQQQLMDLTFRSQQANNGAGDPQAEKQLGQTQNELSRQLRALQQAMEKDAPPGLDHAAAAMQEAGNRLLQGTPGAALPRQTEALKNLQQAMQSLAKDLRSSMHMNGQQQGMNGDGKSDPFGRQNELMPDDNGVKVPDQLEVRRVREILDELQRRSGDMGRSKTERDYIDRLLQDF